jgi:hypothetical protein
VNVLVPAVGKRSFYRPAADEADRVDGTNSVVAPSGVLVVETK